MVRCYSDMVWRQWYRRWSHQHRARLLLELVTTFSESTVLDVWYISDHSGPLSLAIHSGGRRNEWRRLGHQWAVAPERI